MLQQTTLKMWSGLDLRREWCKTDKTENQERDDTPLLPLLQRLRRVVNQSNQMKSNQIKPQNQTMDHRYLMKFRRTKTAKQDWEGAKVQVRRHRHEPAAPRTHVYKNVDTN